MVGGSMYTWSMGKVKDFAHMHIGFEFSASMDQFGAKIGNFVQVLPFLDQFAKIIFAMSAIL